MITICPECGETVLITPDRCLHCGKRFSLVEKIICAFRPDFFQKKNAAARNRLTLKWAVGICCMSAVLIVITMSVIGVTYGKSPGTGDSRPFPAEPVPVIETQAPGDRVPADPVTGTWIRPLYDRTVFYMFSGDGGYSVSDSLNLSSERGVWTKAGENLYNVTVSGRKNILFLYQPETGTVAMLDTPDIRFYPQGNLPADAVIATTATTPVPAPQTTTRGTTCKEAAGFRLCWDNSV